MSFYHIRCIKRWSGFNKYRPNIFCGVKKINNEGILQAQELGRKALDLINIDVDEDLTRICIIMAVAQRLLERAIDNYDIHGLMKTKITHCPLIKEEAANIANKIGGWIKESTGNDENLTIMAEIYAAVLIIKLFDINEADGKIAADEAIRLIDARYASETMRQCVKLAVALCIIDEWINIRGSESSIYSYASCRDSIDSFVCGVVRDTCVVTQDSSKKTAQMALATAAQLVLNVPRLKLAV